jgi:hypothetical protein
MRTRNRALVVLLSAFAGIALAEIGVRVLHVGPIPGPSDVGEIARISSDPDLRVELIPARG